MKQNRISRPPSAMRILALLLLGAALAGLATGCPAPTPVATLAPTTRQTSLQTTAKPVIYLYPTAETEVHVSLEYQGELSCAYPVGGGDWTVTAYPDGRLVDHADGREYSYLFWEGHNDAVYDFSKGFVVRGADTAAFLQEKLAQLGLIPREYNEFIVYWLPGMQDNPYNLIAFQGAAYTDSAILHITPKPDSLLRVFMAYRPLSQAIVIEPQELAGFEREGFTVVEWGGASVED